MTLPAPAKHSLQYRPDIDGLRAVAVLAVVFYHAGLGCTGGFIGVDVFFVISGFLITALILKQLDNGSFSLIEFWERRIRRLFPALAVVVAVVLVVSWFLLLPDDLAGLGQASIAQALFVSNVYFWRTTNYFDGANEEKPLLHTWSLAVEEQFYFVFPILLILLFIPSIRRNLFGLFGVAALISLAISIWGVRHQPFATFFLSPTRAWELLCGSMIALIPASMISDKVIVREVASWIGLAAILIPTIIYHDATPFPGAMALPPCLGTALLIWANLKSERAGNTFVARMLSLKPMVFIGLISYSLYLWHWPVFSFAEYWRTSVQSTQFRWVLVAASFLLAVLSWAFIETPFRRKRLLASRSAIFTFAGVTIAGFCLAGFLLDQGGGFRNRLPAAALEILDAADERSARRAQSDSDRTDSTVEELMHDNLPGLGSGSNVDFLMWGDSHAKVAVPAFEALAKKYERRGAAAIFYSTPPLAGTQFKNKFGQDDANRIANEIAKFVQRHAVADVFIAAYWSLYSKEMNPDEFQTALDQTIKLISDAGANVWLIQDVPDHDVDVPKALIRSHLFRMENWTPVSRSRDRHFEINSHIYAAAAADSPATFIDPSPRLLDEDGNQYRLASSGIPLYYDTNHLTKHGAMEILFPILDETMSSSWTPKTVAEEQGD